MTDLSSAASGPSKDNAGGPLGSGLDDAFNTAVEEVGVDEATFEPSVGDFKPAKTDKPIDTPAPENAAEGTKPEAGKEPAEKKVEGTEGEEPAAAKPETVTAPAHWDPKTRATFEKVQGDEAKKAMIAFGKVLEAQNTRKNQELSEQAKFANSVNSLFTDDHRAMMKRSNIGPVEGIQRLVQYNDFATRNPPGYVRFFVNELAKTTRTPVRDVVARMFPEFFTGGPAKEGEVPKNGAQPPAQQPDPQTQHLLGLVEALHGKVTAFETQQQQSQRRQQEAELGRAQSAIDRFQHEKDEAGNPLRPHFETVYDKMVMLLSTDDEIAAIEDTNERLRRAYDLAVRRDDDLWQETIEREAEKRAAKSRQAADVAKAKGAVSPIKAGGTVANPKPMPASLDEAVDLAMGSIRAT